MKMQHEKEEEIIGKYSHSRNAKNIPVDI